ncbi:MAG: endo-1,4-beta-xylanase [Rikenellaceae bacterium]
MKFAKNLLLLACSLFVLSACAEDDTENGFVDSTDDEVTTDDSTTTGDEEEEEIDLAKLGALTYYIDRTNSPYFKLGAAVDSSIYNNGGDLATLVNANFDELVSTYHMKHAYVVNDDGSMNYTTVNSFLTAAESAGLSVFGHALCWDQGQNTTYLDGLISSAKAQATSANAIATRTYITRSTEEWVEVMINGDCSNQDRTNSSGQNSFQIAMTPTSGDASSGEFKEENGNAYLSVTKNTGDTSTAWRLQFIMDLNSEAVVGDQYQVSFKVRSSDGTTIPKIMLQTAYPDFGYICDISPWSIATTTSWTTASFDLTVPSSTSGVAGRIVLSMGAVADGVTFDFDDVSVLKYTTTTTEEDDPDSDPTEYTYVDIMTNGDFEGSELDYYYTTGTATREIVESEGNPGRALKVVNETVNEAAWQAQIFMDPKVDAMETGDIYKVSLDIRCEDADQLMKVLFSDESGNQMSITQPIYEWTPTSEWGSCAFILDNTDGSLDGLARFGFSIGLNTTTYYFDNVVIESNSGEASSDDTSSSDQFVDDGEYPYYDVVYAALETWIEGILTQTAGRVTAWDVVNEPLDDTIVTSLKSDSGATGNSYFYWQDYLGNTYVRDVVSLARKHGGDDLILFVNDYGLSWSHVDKIGALVDWIEYWESDGVTKIDGIASQMHISYYESETSQATEEAAVVSMLTQMAATGKYVKISELDMEYKNSAGTALQSSELTDEQHQAMADYYEYIVTKYFEIVPASQRYSITHWTPVDPSSTASWRGGEPVGLWDNSYNRKAAYGGYVLGLQNSSN